VALPRLDEEQLKEEKKAKLSMYFIEHMPVWRAASILAGSSKIAQEHEQI
jgi:hypothetical protein